MDGAKRRPPKPLVQRFFSIPTARGDRGWAERKILMVEVEPLDHTPSELVYSFGEKRPWSRVASFTAR